MMPHQLQEHWSHMNSCRDQVLVNALHRLIYPLTSWSCFNYCDYCAWAIHTNASQPPSRTWAKWKLKYMRKVTLSSLGWSSQAPINNFHLLHFIFQKFMGFLKIPKFSSDNGGYSPHISHPILFVLCQGKKTLGEGGTILEVRGTRQRPHISWHSHEVIPAEAIPDVWPLCTFILHCPKRSHTHKPKKNHHRSSSQKQTTKATFHKLQLLDIISMLRYPARAEGLKNL